MEVLLWGRRKTERACREPWRETHRHIHELVKKNVFDDWHTNGMTGLRACTPEMRKMYARTEPPLLHWDEHASGTFPAYNVRRRVLCHSAVSAVDGFRVHTLLAFKYVYGMRLCLKCPHCKDHTTPDGFCVDAEGMSTEVAGGAPGRTLAIVGTSEFQKKRDEHIHYQAVVECLHTSSSLYTVADVLALRGQELVEQYTRYVDYTCLSRRLKDS